MCCLLRLICVSGGTEGVAAAQREKILSFQCFKDEDQYLSLDLVVNEERVQIAEC